MDDGLTSSAWRQKLLNIKRELHEAFNRYSFAVKHILLNFEQSAGVTSLQNLEHCLGIIWDFESDMLTPGLTVYLSKKVRGAHIGQAISAESIDDTVPTQRVVLRVLGSLHDLTGRHLCPLICSAHVVYCQVCKNN